MGQNSSLIAAESSIKSFLKSELSAEQLFSMEISSSVWMKLAAGTDQKVLQLAEFATHSQDPNSNVCHFLSFYYPAFYSKGNVFGERELSLFNILMAKLVNECEPRNRIALIRALISILSYEMYSLDGGTNLADDLEIKDLVKNLLQDINNYLLSDSLIPFQYKIMSNLNYPLVKVSFQLTSVLLTKISIDLTQDEEQLYFYPIRQWNFHRKESVIGSFRNVRLYNEALSGVLNFKEKIINQPLDTLEAICSFLLLVQQDSTYLPTVKMSSIILRDLSSSGDFCRKCNQMVDLTTLGYPFSSSLFPQTIISWADLLFSCILSFLNSQTPQFLRENLLFCQNLTMFMENLCPLVKILSTEIYAKMLKYILQVRNSLTITSLNLVSPLVNSIVNLLEYNFGDHYCLVHSIMSLKAEFLALKVEIGKVTKGKNAAADEMDEKSVGIVNSLF